jgi:tryptophan halogenase
MGAPKHVIVLGNTPSAWISAVFLRRRLQIEVTIVTPEVEVQKTQAPICETFTPDLLELHKLCGLFEHQWLIPCKGSFQTGIRAIGKRICGANIDAILPFSGAGANLDGLDFHHYAKQLNITDFEPYSLASEMARQNKFVHPSTDLNSILSSFNYGIATDANEYGSLMTEYAQYLGVKVVKVDEVKAHCESGQVKHILDANKRPMSANLYIDASEDSALRSMQNLNTSHDDIKADPEGIDAPSYTSRVVATFHKKCITTLYKTVANLPKGLLVSSSLNDRSYYQFYYDNKVYNTKQIEHDLLSNLTDNELLISLTNEDFKNEALLSPWQGNCIAITKNLSGYAPVVMGNLEIAIRAVNRLIDIFPVSDNMDSNAKEYNRLHDEIFARLLEYQQAFRFLVRAPISKSTQNTPSQLNQKTQYKLELFKQSGMLATFDNDPVPPALWINTLMASGNLPENSHALLSHKDINISAKQIKKIKDLVNLHLRKMPSSSQYWQHLVSSYTQ